MHFIGLIASSPVNCMKGDSKLFLHQKRHILAVNQKTSILELYTEFVLFHLDYFELKWITLNWTLFYFHRHIAKRWVLDGFWFLI